MNDVTIRLAEARDRAAIHSVEEAAFGRADEADLVDRLVAGGDAVRELVAEVDGAVVGHVLFSRLVVAGRKGARFAAIALARSFEHHGAACVCFGAAICEHGLDHLEVGDRLAELFAFGGVAHALLDQALGNADADR